MTPAQKGAIGAASLAGILIGASALGGLADTYGCKRMLMVEMVLFVVFLGGLTFAQSYLWVVAAKPIEKLVCGDPALSALDRTLAAAYAKGLWPSSAWTERDRNASRAAQREWLAERDDEAACAKAADPKGCTTSACSVALRR